MEEIQGVLEVLWCFKRPQQGGLVVVELSLGWACGARGGEVRSVGGVGVKPSGPICLDANS